MDLNAVQIFVKVIQLGSFSKAGQDLRIPKSTVSKRVSELEVHLRTTLIKRTTRSLQLTEAGRAFFDQASQSIAGLKTAEANAQFVSGEPMGHLRVTAVSDFASEVMAPLFAGFLAKYPKVSLELVLTDRVLDLVNDNIDIAMRIGKIEDSNLKAIRLGYHRYQLVASPAYLKSCPPLKTPQDLKNHPCLVFAPESEPFPWNLRAGTFKAHIEPKAQFTSSSPAAVKMLAINGAGIALLPIPTCITEIAAKKLQVVLPSWSQEDAPVHFIYQKFDYVLPKITAFLEYMGPKLKPYLQG